MEVFILAICMFATVIIALFIGLGIETYQWNKGICRNCGHEFLFFDFDHTGARGYKCKNCFHTVWISYNYVDKRRK